MEHFSHGSPSYSCQYITLTAVSGIFSECFQVCKQASASTMLHSILKNPSGKDDEHWMNIHFLLTFQTTSHNTSTAKLFLVRWAVRVRCLWQRGKTPASRHSDSVCYKFHGKSAFVGRSPSKASEHRNYCAMFWARISEHFKSAHFGDVN